LDLCAELTLRVVLFLLREPADSRRTGSWYFLPGFQSASWQEAQRLLSEERKPIIVAPLLEPRALGVWAISGQTERVRASANNELANQQKAFESKIVELALADGDTVKFSSGESSFPFPIRELRRWLREYLVVAGITLERSSSDPRDVHLLVRRADGSWSQVLL
jgi:hypothetical protein